MARKRPRKSQGSGITKPEDGDDPFCGAGSRLHGIINDSAHLRYCPSIRCAPCQSSEDYRARRPEASPLGLGYVDIQILNVRNPV